MGGGIGISKIWVSISRPANKHCKAKMGNTEKKYNSKAHFTTKHNINALTTADKLTECHNYPSPAQKGEHFLYFIEI